MGYLGDFGYLKTHKKVCTPVVISMRLCSHLRPTRFKEELSQLSGQKYHITQKEVFLFFFQVLNSGSSHFPEDQHKEYLNELRGIFKYYTHKFGVDDNKFIMALSFNIWFNNKKDNLR